MECISFFYNYGKFNPKFNKGKLKEIAVYTIIIAVVQDIKSDL